MFTTTVLVTVSTDLLWGIAAGIVAKLILEIVIVTRVERGRPDGREPLGWSARRWLGETGELFRNPVVKSVTVGDAYHMYFGRPMVCFNSMHLDAELAAIPSGASAVYLHITDLVTLIDHTTATMLLEFVDNFKRTGRGIATIVGLDRLRARSHAEASMRISAPVLAQERAAALESLARISLTYTGTEQPDPLVLLERISLTHVAPIPGQEDHPIRAGHRPRLAVPGSHGRGHDCAPSAGVHLRRLGDVRLRRPRHGLDQPRTEGARGRTERGRQAQPLLS